MPATRCRKFNLTRWSVGNQPGCRTATSDRIGGCRLSCSRRPIQVLISELLLTVCSPDDSGSPAGESEDDLVLSLLFVCSMNRWRSPTAEKIYATDRRINARSRGTRRKAVRTVRGDDLKWADMVLVMEPKHAQQLRSRFPGETAAADIRVLDIPDEYRFMDPELIQLIRDSVDFLLTS